MRVAIIGAGFSGMAASALLAKEGHDVTVFEKNSSPGGRAWVFKDKGYIFDMGPSWYMMPEIHEKYFANFNKKPSDYYKLELLDPQYQVIGKQQTLTISSDLDKVCQSFENIETGAGDNLKKLISDSKEIYDVSLEKILYTDQLKASKIIQPKLGKLLLQGKYYRSYESIIKSYFKEPILQQTLQFMTVFLGGSPKNIPGLYTLMTYADMGRKIWYPQGGFGTVVDAYYKTAVNQGVKFKFNDPVKNISKDQNFKLSSNSGDYDFDIVISSSEYSHTDVDILSEDLQIYSQEKWNTKSVSPTAQLFYFGFNKKLPKLEHHNLFFDSRWQTHFDSIEQKTFTQDPLFYASVPSKSDSSVAPKGCENVFVLVPQASGLKFTKQQQTSTRAKVLERISKVVGFDVSKLIDNERYEDSQYFIDMFNAQGGNAFGLAHTLKQSSIFRPPIKHPKVDGLYFTGQFTNPGTGVPLVIISAEVVANKIKEDFE